MLLLLIRRLRSPQQVQRWLQSLQYNPKDTLRTLPEVAQRKTAHCLEGTLSAAALLEPHGYPPLILDLESTGPLEHTVFIYQHKGRWGSVGMSHDIGLHGRKPVYRTVEALVRGYIIPYIDHESSLTGWGVLDLRTLSSNRWKYSRRNVWYVERALQQMPHHRLKISPAVVKHWRAKHQHFRQRHPKQQPNYFPNQHHWA